MQTRSLVGIALGTLCRYSFLALDVQTPISQRSESRLLIQQALHFVPYYPVISLLPNELSLTASSYYNSLPRSLIGNISSSRAQTLPALPSTTSPRSKESVGGSSDSLNRPSESDNIPLEQDFWSRVCWTMVGSLAQHVSRLDTCCTAQGFAALVNSLGMSLLPLVEVQTILSRYSKLSLSHFMFFADNNQSMSCLCSVLYILSYMSITDHCIIVFIL